MSNNEMKKINESMDRYVEGRDIVRTDEAVTHLLGIYHDDPKKLRRVAENNLSEREGKGHVTKIRYGVYRVIG